MINKDRPLPKIGERYVSTEKRSAGRVAEVIEPACPGRHGFVHLRHLATGRPSTIRFWYFYDRYVPEPATQDEG